MLCYRWVIAATLTGVPVIGLPVPEAEAESCYMCVFSHQAANNAPQSSHTFATFVRARVTEPRLRRGILESHTISWLPASRAVRVLARRERGVNLDLAASLEFAASLNTRVSMWGPYQIKRELYDRAVRQVQRLQSGAVGYKVLDARFRPATATNCIHAVSDIDIDNRLLETGTARGDAASLMVVRHLRSWIIDLGRVHEWVGTELGLDRQSITVRGLEESP